MEPATVWDSEISTVDDRKKLVYKLRPGTYNHEAMSQRSEDEKMLMETYCAATDPYVKLNSDQCKLLGLDYPVFLSQTFIDVAILANGTYPWNKVRDQAHANIVIPSGNATAGNLSWAMFVEYWDHGTREDKACLRGGYIFPGRQLNGDIHFFTLGPSYKAFYQSSAWEKIFKASTALVEGWGDGAAFRSINKPGLELVIQPYGLDPRAVPGGYEKLHGVGWDLVVEAFQRVLAGDDTIKTKYRFQFPNNSTQGFTRLSVNPFYHYETWISWDHYAEFWRADRPMPRRDVMTAEKRLKLIEYRDKTNLTAADYKKSQNLMFSGTQVTWDTHVGLIELSAERIIKGAGKRKGARTQNAVMNKQSAPKIAQDLFGWDGNDKPTPFHIAEWLHISAFSFGGLADRSEAWETSQVQMNMVFGSSETNSFMLRYEKAWQELFKLEHELRSVWNQNANNFKLGRVHGALSYANNKNLDVLRNIKDPDGSRNIFKAAFNGSKGWQACYDECPWICFALQYRLTINDLSLLLEWEKPEFITDFSPFGRPFFTKGETLVDTWLLKKLYDIKLDEERIKRQQQQNPLHGHFTNVVKSEPVKPIVRANLVQPVNNEDDFVESMAGQHPDANERPDKRHFGGDFADTVDKDQKEPAATEPKTETPMTKLESKLTDTSTFEHLESLDDYVDSISGFLQFRETLDVTSIDKESPMRNAALLGENKGAQETEESQHQRQTEEAQQPFWSGQEHFDALSVANDINTIIVGGIKLNNPSLVIANNDGLFADIPISICPIPGPATEEGILLVSTPEAIAPETNTAPRAKPILLLSSTARPEFEVKGMPLPNTASIEKTAARAFSEDVVRTATVPAYTIGGDLAEDLFSIPGLRGKIHTFQNSDPDAPLLEIVKPDLGGLQGGPMEKLFSFVDDNLVRSLPIDNIQFIYSEDHSDMFHSAGLRIEGDVKFTGTLQPVADLLNIVFGEGNKAPSGLHLAAHLSEERDWRRMPRFSNFALQGSFDDMSVWVGDWLNFTRIGVEVSAAQMTRAGTLESRWSMGYGLFGELDIYKVPGNGPAPLHVKYRIDTVGSNYQMSMDLTSDAWTSIFGLPNLTIRGVRFVTGFSSSSFQKSFAMDISAFMTLGKTELYLTGGFSEEENYLEAEVGNMTWADIVNAYSQLMGESMAADTQGNDIKFENLYIKVSTKGVTLAGKVSLNGRTSVNGLVSFDQFGLTIQGGIENFKVDGTDIEIKEAGFDVFVSSKFSGRQGRVNRFAIRGDVEFSGVRVKAHLHTSSQGASKPRQWFVYGTFEGEVRVSDFAEVLKGSDMDNNLVLKNVAILATNMDKGIDNSLNPLRYPVGKGLSVCALIRPLETINRLAGNKQVDGLMFAASFRSNGDLKFAIHLPASMSITVSESTEISNFGVAVELSKTPKLILEGDLIVKMKDQEPLVFQVDVFAGPTDAGVSAETHTLWKNPFGISEKVEIRELAVELAFNYVTGPSTFALSGAGQAGEIACNAGMKVSQRPNQQLVTFNVSKLNVAQIIRFTGDIIDCQALREVSGGDFLIFSEAGMYFSTGATIASREYPPGISAHGILEVFGKRAQFDATVGESGIRFDGSVDNFSIGPLDVRSASGGPKAILIIEMTKEKQEIYIDGMISFLDLNIKMLVKASVKPLVLDTDIQIGFTDLLTFKLRAVVNNVTDHRDLSKANLRFEASLDGDILGFICDGVIAMLDYLQNAIGGGIDSLEFSLQQRKKEIEAEKSQLQKQLDEIKASYEAARAERQKEIEARQAKRKEAQDELDALQKALDDHKFTQIEQENAARQKLQDAKTQREAAYRAKTAEYDDQLSAVRKEQQGYEQRMRELQEQKTINFGDQIRRLDQELSNVAYLEKELEPHERRYREAVREFDNAGPFKKSYLSFVCLRYWTPYELAEGEVKARRAIVKELRRFIDTPEYRAFEDAINQVISWIKKVALSIAALVTQGSDGFAREWLKNEDLEIELAKQKLDALMDANSNLMRVIQQAQAALDVRKPDLLDTIDRADEAIRVAQEDKVLAGLKADVERLERLHHDMAGQVSSIEGGLELARSGVNQATDELKALLNGLKKVIFRIKSIKVAIDGRDIVRGGSLTFYVVGEIAGLEKKVEVRWSPKQTATDLFKGIVKEAF